MPFHRLLDFLRTRQREAASKIDVGLLVSLLLLLLLVWLFCETAGWVEDETTQSTDEKILLWFRDNLPQDQPGRPSKFASSVRDVTALGSGTVLIFFTVSVAAYFALQGRWRTTL